MHFGVLHYSCSCNAHFTVTDQRIIRSGTLRVLGNSLKDLTKTAKP